VTPDRLRTAGWLTLLAGVAAAAAVYIVEARRAAAALDDATALGYRRSLEHGIGVMMGSFGLLLTRWQEWLASPAGNAALVVAASVVVAGCCFRVAWVREQNERM